MKYSFIIISFNEEKTICKTLNSIFASEKNFDIEIILVDGGSTDATLALASEYKVKIVQTQPGRGSQFKFGAQEATGDILIFLHSDTTFPKNGLIVINDKFSKGITAATFQMEFDDNSPIFNLYGWFAKIDSVWTSFGDQGIVLTKELYNETGGFIDSKIFEDVDLLRKVRAKTKIYSLPAKVITSARRFRQNGIVRQQLRNFIYVINYFFGASDFTLNQKYSKIKKKKNALIIFCKVPESGKVKTRLAKSVGNELAKQFYNECVKHIINNIEKLKEADCYIYFSGKLVNESLFGFSEPFLRQQNGKNLGCKMKNAINDLICEGYKKVILTGSDIPSLNSNIIQESLIMLNKCDYVVGPDKGGGFYLFGTRGLIKDEFNNIDWSTDQVFQQLENNITDKNKKVIKVKFLIDIDTIDDLNNWLEIEQFENELKQWILKNIKMEKYKLL